MNCFNLNDLNGKNSMEKSSFTPKTKDASVEKEKDRTLSDHLSMRSIRNDDDDDDGVSSSSSFESATGVTLPASSSSQHSSKSMLGLPNNTETKRINKKKTSKFSLQFVHNSVSSYI